MSFGRRILLLAIAGTAATSLLMTAVIWVQRNDISTVVIDDIDAKARESCVRVACQLHESMKLVNDAEMSHVETALALTSKSFAQRELSVGEDSVKWHAINELDGSVREIDLPRLLLEGQWLGQNGDPKESSLFVDDVDATTDGACTIFQRINAQGDMLRICTSAIGKDGRRDVGTYIPAVQPDGKPNPVVASLLRGERFLGRAFVADSWWTTGYDPIKNGDGDVVGAVFYGRPQESLASVRRHVMSLDVGKSGYVYVVQGTGQNRGAYIISKDGARDGDNIYDAKDAGGRFFIQEVIRTATAAKEDEAGIVEYPWQNEGETIAREKLAAVAYFEPWDWVIGVSAYKDDFRDAATVFEDGMSALTTAALVTGIGVSLLVAVVSIFIVRRMLKPLFEVNRVSFDVADASNQLAVAAEQLSSGTRDSASSLEETAASLEEITATVRQNSDSADLANRLANSSRETAEMGGSVVALAVEAMAEINQSSRKIADIIATIDDIAFQTNLLALNAAVEAARAGEQGRGFAVVAGEVRNLAQPSATAAREIKGLIEDSVNKVKVGSELVNKSGESLHAIVSSVKRVTDIVGEIAAATREQSAGIEQINRAVAQLDEVNQSNASQTDEMSGTAIALSGQSDQLQEIVASFNLNTADAGKKTLAPSTKTSEPRGSKKAKRSPKRSARPLESQSDEDLALVGAGAGNFEEF